jgi:hypothetical protein
MRIQDIKFNTSAAFSLSLICTCTQCGTWCTLQPFRVQLVIVWSLKLIRFCSNEEQICLATAHGAVNTSVTRNPISWPRVRRSPPLVVTATESRLITQSFSTRIWMLLFAQTLCYVSATCVTLAVPVQIYSCEWQAKLVRGRASFSNCCVE